MSRSTEHSWLHDLFQQPHYNPAPILEPEFDDWLELGCSRRITGEVIDHLHQTGRPAYLN